MLSSDLIQNLKTGVLVLTQGLEVVWANDSALQLLEITGKKLINMQLSDWVIEQDMNGLAEPLKACITDGRGFTFRELHFARRGYRSTVDASFTRFEAPISSTRKPFSPDIRILIELAQIDNLVKITRDAKYSTDEANLKNYLRGLSHEIKNPLGGIKGSAQLMAKEADASIFQDYLRVIIDETNRLTNLVDRLIGPHRQTQLEKRNIHEVLEHCRALISAESAGQIYVDRDYDPSLPELLVDNERLTQAIINIAKNSIEALTESHTPQPEVKFSTRATRKQNPANGNPTTVVRIRIEDNGPGIPENLKDQLFFPMVSGRAHGSGIGLSITQTIISRHNGWIEVESEPGRTTFDIILPIGEKL